MDDPRVVALLTVAAVAAVNALAILVAGGGNLQRIKLAGQCFLRALRDERFAEQVQPLLLPPEPTEERARPSGAPLRMLALLQREGRLLDFLLEDLQSYPDAQIGAAVRDIHRQCQSSLKEHLVLEPVISEKEGATVEVPAGFDPSAIRLTGNVTGQPPFRGTLQHHGWQVKEVKLAPPPEGQDELVLMPAEVEIP